MGNEPLVFITTTCALVALVLAAAVGITTRLGVRLVLIAAMLLAIPEAQRAISRVAANQQTGRSDGQHDERRVQSCRHSS